MCSLSLTSCFTGIESTPRITAKDVERNVPASSKESELAAMLNPPTVTQWKHGRRFLVTDSKISLIFEKEPAVSEGTILLFDKLTDEISFAGDTISVLTFNIEGNEQTGSTLRYKVGVAPESISPTFTLPMSVDLDMVENARKILVGKQYYIISSLRVDSTLQSTSAGRRYIATTITDVAPGNADYPLRLDIIDDQNKRSSVAMTVGAARSSTRNFDKIFEAENPRLRYPTITDATWQHIVNSRVAKGMTTTECQLALGAPRDIRKWHNGGSFFEGWACDNGNYLIFIDGFLSDIH